MTNPNYVAPVNQLLTLGEPPLDLSGSVNYLELGIAASDLPALSQMVLDKALYNSEDTTLCWGPIHAWRALAQLQVEAAIAPLVEVVQQFSDNVDWWEWIIEELPLVLSQFGAAAIPALAASLADATQSEEVHFTVINCFEALVNAHPPLREAVVAVLTQQLAQFATNTPAINGQLIGALVVDCQAVESAAVMEQAFQAHRVDPNFIGNWDEVQVRLGLKSAAELPRRMPLYDPEMPTPDRAPGFHQKSGGAVDKVKAKRQQQKQSRRKNRPKKK